MGYYFLIWFGWLVVGGLLGSLWRWGLFRLLIVSALSIVMFRGQWPVWVASCGAFVGWQFRHRLQFPDTARLDSFQPRSVPNRCCREVLSRGAGVLSWGLLGHGLVALAMAWFYARKDAMLPEVWGTLTNRQGPWVDYFTGVYLVEDAFGAILWAVVAAHVAFFADRCLRSFLVLLISLVIGLCVVASHGWLIHGIHRR